MSQQLPHPKKHPDMPHDTEDTHGDLLEELLALKRFLDKPDPLSGVETDTVPEANMEAVISLPVNNNNSESALLDLQSIFDDEMDDSDAGTPLVLDIAPATTEFLHLPADPSPLADSEQFQHIIQRIVEELRPQMENQLREQLLALSQDYILELADKILDS